MRLYLELLGLAAGGWRHALFIPPEVPRERDSDPSPERDGRLQVVKGRDMSPDLSEDAPYTVHEVCLLRSNPAVNEAPQELSLKGFGLLITADARSFSL